MAARATFAAMRIRKPAAKQEVYVGRLIVVAYRISRGLLLVVILIGLYNIPVLVAHQQWAVERIILIVTDAVIDVAHSRHTHQWLVSISDHTRFFRIKTQLVNNTRSI